MDLGMAIRAAGFVLLTGSALLTGCAAQPVAECPVDILERANARADDLRWRIAQAERRFETLKVQVDAYTEVAFLRQFGMEDAGIRVRAGGPAIVAEVAGRVSIDGGTVLDEASAESLREVARRLTTRFKGRSVVVEGRVGATGSAEGHMSASGRALAVARFLISLGVEPERVSAVAHAGARTAPPSVDVLVMPIARNTNVCASF